MGRPYPECRWRLPEPEGEEYEIWRNTVDGHRWARPGLVSLILAAAAEYRRRWPGAHLIIGDLDAPGPRHSTHDRGVDVDLGNMPDTAPTLAVLAAFAQGTTRMRNIANLRVKETDRLAALSTELGKMNVPTQMHDDGLSIMPTGKPKAAAVDTYEDHRIAMSFAVAGLVTPGVIIKNPSCVEKSFPDFWEVFK